MHTCACAIVLRYPAAERTRHFAVVHAANACEHPGRLCHVATIEADGEHLVVALTNSINAMRRHGVTRHHGKQAPSGAMRQSPDSTTQASKCSQGATPSIQDPLRRVSPLDVAGRYPTQHEIVDSLPVAEWRWKKCAARADREQSSK